MVLCARVCARVYAIVRVCSLLVVYIFMCVCVCLLVGVILWMCVAVHVDFPVLLDLAHDTRHRNADGESGVMCRVLS